ncbi:MAG: hypothetical protein U5K77_03870 [Candidatus Saccharibacteria bacterium]|nr:hypothetical protein [Candidatus Saccharibacteria bacterium]
MPYNQETASETTRFERINAKRHLKIIRKALLTYPREDMVDVGVDEFNICSRERPSRNRTNEVRLGFNALRDGVAVFYVTEEFLEDRSHRFIFPDDGEPRYHREPFNVDCQKMPSRGLDVEGVDQFISHRAVIHELDNIAPEITLLNEGNWVGLTRVRGRSAQC